MEVYNYYSCVQQETNSSIKAFWERFLDYELGHLNVMTNLFEKLEGRDAGEILDDQLPEPIPFKSQRDFVRQVLESETYLRSKRHPYVSIHEEGKDTLNYRNYLNQEEIASEMVSVGYQWEAGTKLTCNAVKKERGRTNATKKAIEWALTQHMLIMPHYKKLQKSTPLISRGHQPFFLKLMKYIMKNLTL